MNNASGIQPCSSLRAIFTQASLISSLVTAALFLLIDFTTIPYNVWPRSSMSLPGFKIITLAQLWKTLQPSLKPIEHVNGG